MRRRLLVGCAALLLSMLALGSTSASACDDDCGCGYGYGYGYSGYYVRPAYSYYYAPRVYLPNPGYSYYTYYSPYYGRQWGYAPRAHYVGRHTGRRHW
jgi:hypothetical protein